MPIKLKEIAKELGVSSATVSFAVHDRPGISPDTKKRILDHIRMREEEHLLESWGKDQEPKGMVLMLNYVKNGPVLEREITEKEHPVIADIKKSVGKKGYTFMFRLFHEQTDSLDKLLAECRELGVKGIYIMAAEMHRSDIHPFLKLHVPIVTGDNLFYEEGLDSFLIDNKEGIRRGVDYLADKGHSHIVYLAENLDFFNFVERRGAFILEMAKRECGDARDRIRHLGSNVGEVYESMKKCLDEGLKDTTAFLLESSVISMGVGRALMERGIRIPKEVSLLGFDALPPVSIPGVNLTLVKGTHSKRHLSAVRHLIRRIEDEKEEIMRVYYKTRFVEGDSVFDKAEYTYG